jgi:hypothetical protein
MIWTHHEKCLVRPVKFYMHWKHMDCTGIRRLFIKVIASISIMRHLRNYRKQAWSTPAAVQEKIYLNGGNVSIVDTVARVISLDGINVLCG